VWIRMDSQQLKDFLNDQIKKYEINKKYYVKSSSIIFALLSLFLSLLVSFLYQIIFHIETISFIVYAIFTLAIFLILEILEIIPILKEYIDLKNLNGDDKREYLLKKLEKKTNRFCPDCNMFYWTSPDSVDTFWLQ